MDMYLWLERERKKEREGERERERERENKRACNFIFHVSFADIFYTFLTFDFTIDMLEHSVRTTICRYLNNFLFECFVSILKPPLNVLCMRM